MATITKTVEVEADVDIEIEFSDVEEFIEDATENELRKIKALVSSSFYPEDMQFKIETLADQMKLEFLQSIWDKYTCEQMEEKFK